MESWKLANSHQAATGPALRALQYVLLPPRVVKPSAIPRGSSYCRRPHVESCCAALPSAPASTALPAPGWPQDRPHRGRESACYWMSARVPGGLDIYAGALLPGRPARSDSALPWAWRARIGRPRKRHDGLFVEDGGC